ncbi:MAG TPA: metallophosphoesterase family protein [Trueperaceae bacterium]
MRLAILSDIHGNLQALSAVLDDISRQGADQVIVNGDLVNRGPNNVAVMERVMGAGYIVTLGNHDDLMRKWVSRDPDIPGEWFDDPFWEGTAWCARQLQGAGWLDALGSLPMTHRVAFPKAPVLLVSHGSPRHYREGYGSYLTGDDIAEIRRLHPADIFVGSHTHRPIERRWGRTLVLNTGATGTPFNGDPRAQYLLLTLSEGVWHAEFRRVAYDRRLALEAFTSLNYLSEGGLSAHIFYEELRCARSFFTPFWNWTEDEGRPRDWESWAAYQEAFAERFAEPQEDS